MGSLPRIAALILLAAAAPAAADGVLAPGQPLTEEFLSDLVEVTLTSEVEGSLRIEIDQPVLPLSNRSRMATVIHVRGVEREGRSGRFRGLVLGSTEDGGTFTLPLAGHAVELVEVPVLRRRIERGELIAAADLEWRELPTSRLPRDAVMHLAELSGGEARRDLMPGRALTGRDVGPRLLVRRGRPVRVIYSLNGLVITTLGTAQDDGAENELVRVTNTESRRQLEGLVTGPDHVTLSIAPRVE